MADTMNPNQLSATDRKKQREVMFFRFAQEQLPELLPKAEVEDLEGERPDIVVGAGPESYGVEVTEFVNEGGRSREDKRLKVCALAQARAVVGDGFSVAILFRPETTLSSVKERSSLAAALAELVRNQRALHPDTQWQEKVDCYGTPLWPFASLVFIHYMPNWPASRWYPAMAWSVPLLSSGDVSEAIKPKEARLEVYRKRAKRVILLIVAEGFSGSTAAHVTDEALNATYQTGFSEVLVLDFGNNRIHRLNTCPLDA